MAGLGLGLGAGMTYYSGPLSRQTTQVASGPLQTKPRYADREELEKVSALPANTRRFANYELRLWQS